MVVGFPTSTGCLQRPSVLVLSPGQSAGVRREEEKGERSLFGIDYEGTGMVLRLGTCVTRVVDSSVVMRSGLTERGLCPRFTY